MKLRTLLLKFRRNRVHVSAQQLQAMSAFILKPRFGNWVERFALVCAFWVYGGFVWKSLTVLFVLNFLFLFFFLREMNRVGGVNGAQAPRR